MKDKEFDLESFRKEAIAKLQAGEGLLGEGGAFTPLLKAFLEEALEGEVEAHIAEGDEPNRKNGKGKKKVRTSLGEIEITTPRDRQSTFQPKVVPKRSRNLPRDLERQIMALYARGSSLGDIRDFLEEMYDVEVSPSTISRVTDKII
ncbi:MAG: transposase, partial [Bacteroidota bacterium]